jgi:shikimate dehydrogenase
MVSDFGERGRSMSTLFGLLGWPVAHSASPAMMNAAFAATGIDGVYVAFAVPHARLDTALAGLEALGAGGVNVTIPHKQRAFRWVQTLTRQARLAGAVNTIRFAPSDGDGNEAVNGSLVNVELGDEGAPAVGVVGHNTDVEGWWTSLTPHLTKPPERVVIFGAGGAARAALAGLALHAPSAQVSLIAREPIKAAGTADAFAAYIRVRTVPWEERHAAVAEADLVVNATPIGMWPKEDQSPLFDTACLHSGQVVQDMVYRPLETLLLRQAAERGATVVDGLAMLVNQGAAAFTFWTGREAPVAVMREAALAHLRL